MTYEQEALQAIRVGKERARMHFDKLGNHTEAHVTEKTLAMWLTLAYFHGRLHGKSTRTESKSVTGDRQHERRENRSN